MRILLIEDDLIAARGISLMLKSNGAVVDHADTGEEGLELSKHYDYDIVILDLMLPDIDGLVLCSLLKSIANVPIVICSASGRRDRKSVV